METNKNRSQIGDKRYFRAVFGCQIIQMHASHKNVELSPSLPISQEMQANCQQSLAPAKWLGKCLD